MASLKHNPNINDTREHDFMLAVGALGRAEGLGQDSRPSLALRCVEAAAEGYIVPDDAASIWGKFQSERQSKINPDLAWDVAPSENVQVSKLKAFLKLGVLALGANRLDPVGTMDRACKILLEGVAAGHKAGGSKFDTLLKVARVQQDKEHHQSDMDDDDLRGVLFPDKDEATEEKLVKAALKAIERVGKAFPSDYTKIAAEPLEQRLADLIQFREEAEMAAKGFVRSGAMKDITPKGNDGASPIVWRDLPVDANVGGQQLLA